LHRIAQKKKLTLFYKLLASDQLFLTDRTEFHRSKKAGAFVQAEKAELHRRKS